MSQYGQEEREFVILRTYEKIWKTPFKIYSIENIKLLFPINPWELLYFGIGLLIVFVLGKILPFIQAIPFVFRFILLPYGVMKFFTKIKLDGKQPHKFFFDYLVYAVSPKKSERFQPYKEPKKIRFVTPVVFRKYIPESQIEEEIAKRRDTKKIKKGSAARAKKAADEEKRLGKEGLNV